MLFKVLLVLVSVQVATACFGLGGCGGCGMSCGRFCSRARGSKTLSFDSKTPIGDAVPPSNPDEEFLECCKDRDLPGACLSKCNYRAYTAATLRSMFFRMDACPIEAASALHFCASRSKDHRSCCARNGVGNTEAGGRCFLFCDEEPRNRTQLDLTFLPCLDKFEEMKQCFWSDTVKDYQFNSYSRSALPEAAGSQPLPQSAIYRPIAAQYAAPNAPPAARPNNIYGTSAGVAGISNSYKPLQPLAVRSW
uniref:DB domain-containing protein n=1 Tax=Panagrellus redivivus TaxID=6233 RepID=A0A7E4ZSS4_PANRE